MSIAKTQDDNQAAEMAEAFKPLVDAAEKAATVDAGGPAFPIPTYADGMTLRDYFAAKAMQGFVANDKNYLKFSPDDDAAYFYAVADAMLARRKVR